MNTEPLKRTIYKICNRFIPKNKKKIAFESIPDFTDNSKAFYDYFIENNLDNEYKLHWQVDEKNNNINVPQYLKFSKSGLYHLFRSKYIVTTHQNFMDIKSPKQTTINLWHGMPLKAMGYAENKNDNEILPFPSRDHNYILISTSNIMRSSLSACFYMDPRKIYNTGQPRSDKLFKTEKSEANLFKLIEHDLNYDKIILFAPTYRQGFERNEGELFQNILNLENYEEETFLEYLEDNNILFLIKMHPFEENHYKKTIKNSKNLKLITSKKLQEEFLDLYDFLGAVDILITDYSSIYFDFLLLNKPMLFTPTDLEDYSNFRGLILEPYDFWAPGPKVTEFEDFLQELDNCINDPIYYKKERKLVNDIVNKFQDDKSSERVFNLVFKSGLF
ncbi:CDP-glycerol glycerophosphotransferase family protein [Methanobacterium alcaliphilum]|uniref:CDP-glycerol glycerophosphotransferase family protein n=1 Tax=Methanobacterium alcaliphilum TaxID=392018 RepID=UPI00200A2317|nr:CDP-glycerol glycerophosphotransferase family protein [Methanobacterium alcaliphilum]MCK9150779.1 CDP-glycerol glycerophosphotransferase family protein [Methanobacterium alcaliphilum]